MEWMLPRCKTWPHVTEHAQADQGLHSHPGLESHNSLCSQQHRTKGIKGGRWPGGQGWLVQVLVAWLGPIQLPPPRWSHLGTKFAFSFLFFFLLIVISTLCQTGRPDHRRQSMAQSSTSSIDKPGRCWTLGASMAKHSLDGELKEEVEVDKRGKRRSRMDK